MLNGLLWFDLFFFLLTMYFCAKVPSYRKTTGFFTCIVIFHVVALVKLA